MCGRMPIFPIRHLIAHAQIAHWNGVICIVGVAWLIHYSPPSNGLSRHQASTPPLAAYRRICFSSMPCSHMSASRCRALADMMRCSVRDAKPLYSVPVALSTWSMDGCHTSGLAYIASYMICQARPRRVPASGKRLPCPWCPSTVGATRGCRLFDGAISTSWHTFRVSATEGL